jgi:DsrE/DsrF-like family
MKVAYIFTTSRVHEILSNMIVPQMEKGNHGVDVVGMFLFGDNTFLLQKGNYIGERLEKLKKKNGMLLMACDKCAIERKIQDNLVDGARIGCFPDLYNALTGNMPDQVITL